MYFDHSQHIKDMRLIAGEATSTIEHTAPFTAQEFYRAIIDPGFQGDFAFIEADLYFDRYSSVVQNVTWAWQILSYDESSWEDLYYSGTESWGGYAQSRRHVGVASSGFLYNLKVPFQIRLLVTAASAATVAVRIGTYTPAIRVIGVPD